ncbi:hypothetical protein N7G274_008098 [Stereocaulon virgatum]|uniref:Uncharacterized protein n=1 Tax=Stereocaulon virgatum TaxID=373712 RepID=A0ABR4A2Q9_9LECA
MHVAENWKRFDVDSVWSCKNIETAGASSLLGSKRPCRTTTQVVHSQQIPYQNHTRKPYVGAHWKWRQKAEQLLARLSYHIMESNRRIDRQLPVAISSGGKCSIAIGHS